MPQGLPVGSPFCLEPPARRTATAKRASIRTARYSGTACLLANPPAMPICFIHSHRPRPDIEVEALMTALHEAMQDALRVPDDDHDIRYVEHRAAHCRIPGGKSQDYLLVTVLMFPGRSVEAKRALYQAIVRRFAEAGTRPEEVNILLQPLPLEDFGLRGGQAACDLALGFKIDV